MVVAADLTVPGQVQKVPNGVPPYLKFISVKDTKTEAYVDDPDSCCDKAHLVVFLNFKHWNENKENKEKNKMLMGSRGAGSKEAKYGGRKYNRIAFFADCLDKGSVCCKVLETQKESTTFFDNMMFAGFGVGSMYVVEEPRASTEHLGKTLSIPQLSDRTRIYPVEGKLANLVPSSPLLRPNEGETKYFAYHGVKNLVVGASSVECNSCGGRFCDRQAVADLNPGQVPCGCFYRRDNYKYIIEHELRIPCEKSISVTNLLKVPKFRSFRFDQLIFRDGCQKVFSILDPGDPIACKVLRSHVKKLVELVNKKHGWTIVGWTRTGQVQDDSEAGNREAFDIASEDLSPHVTYLQPSDESDVDETIHAEYKKLLLTETSFLKAMTAERERLEKEANYRELEAKRARMEQEAKEEAKKARTTGTT